MKTRVLFHNNCFDGACSAAVFTRLYRAAIHPDTEFAYTGLAHQAGEVFSDGQFDGDDNAVVDFKYTRNPRLTWWFDHHQSAFLTPADKAHFEADRSGKKFFDPGYKSCTKFISTVAREKFGFTAPDLDDLVYWADIIDGALYPDSATAVRMEAPAIQLTLLIEATKDPALIPRLIPMLASRPLAAIAADPEIHGLFQPLFDAHLASVDVIRSRAIYKHPVIFFDLIGTGMEGYNKFIPYDLFPGAVYVVSLSQSSYRTKISVGSNPWNYQPRMHNIATICERYGGGGHAKVGAISMLPEEADKARRAAAEIVAELKTNP